MVVLLAVVLWLDGWRRRADGTIVLVRVGLGPWRARAPWAEVGRFALVAWWSPIVIPFLLDASPTLPLGGSRAWAADFDISLARGRRRLRRVKAGLTTLRTLGALLLVWIAFVIPLFTSRFGIAGLIRGILIAFVLAAMLAGLAIMELRALGLGWWPSLRRTAHLLSPFSAPQAAEVVATAALEDVDPAVRVATVLGEARFLQWIRSAAYDELHGRTDAAGGEPSAPATLVRALPRLLLERATGTRPDERDSDARFCPRCARTYQEGVTTCSECGDLSLVVPATMTGARR
jgi:hypothetical protein